MPKILSSSLGFSPRTMGSKLVQMLDVWEPVLPAAMLTDYLTAVIFPALKAGVDGFAPHSPLIKHECCSTCRTACHTTNPHPLPPNTHIHRTHAHLTPSSHTFPHTAHSHAHTKRPRVDRSAPPHTHPHTHTHTCTHTHAHTYTPPRPISLDHTLSRLTQGEGAFPRCDSMVGAPSHTGPIERYTCCV